MDHSIEHSESSMASDGDDEQAELRDASSGGAQRSGIVSQPSASTVGGAAKATKVTKAKTAKDTIATKAATAACSVSIINTLSTTASRRRCT